MKHIKKSKRYINISGGGLSKSTLDAMSAAGWKWTAEDRKDPNFLLAVTKVENMIRDIIYLDEMFPKWKTYCREQEDTELEAAIDDIASQVINYVTTWQEVGRNHLTGRDARLLPGLSNQFLYKIIYNLHKYYERMHAHGFLSPADRKHDSKSKDRIDAYQENIDSFARIEPRPNRKKEAPPHMADVVGAAMVAQGSHTQLSADDQYVLDMTAHNAELAAEKGELLHLAAIDKELKIELIQAVKRGEVDEVKRLLRDGADPNAKNEKGEPMMYLAASENRPDCIQLLNENGADINAPLKKGYTPIMVAAHKGNIEALTMLSRLGADATISIRHQGTRKTALDFAQGKQWFNAARALLDPGHATRDAGSLPPLADSVAARQARLAGFSGEPEPQTEPETDPSPESSPDASLPQLGPQPLNELSVYLNDQGYAPGPNLDRADAPGVLSKVNEYLETKEINLTMEQMDVAEFKPNEVMWWLVAAGGGRKILYEHQQKIVAAYKQISPDKYSSSQHSEGASIVKPHTYHTQTTGLPDYSTEPDAWARTAADADSRLIAARDALASLADTQQRADALFGQMGEGGVSPI